MKRIVIAGPYDVRIEDIEIPKPGPGMLLVKAELSGVSAGTEMTLYRGTYPNFKLKKYPQWQDYPVLPGYEMVGTVVAVGEEADAGESAKRVDSLAPASAVITTGTSDFKVGDRVICMGEHAEYVCVPAGVAAKIADNVSSEEATLAVLGTTSMHAIRRSQVEYGDTVAVIGMGIVGFLTMQHAKNSGARRVIALDLDDARLAVAKEAGADICINPGKVNVEETIKALNNGILADVVIEASGHKGTERMACEIVRERGRVTILGFHDPIEFGYLDFFFKEIRVNASQAIGPEAGLPYSYVRWCSDQSLKWAMQLISEGKLKGCFKPKKYYYTEIHKVYDMIDKGNAGVGMQIILTWE